MGSRDPRVDAYILKSAGFAQPILRSLRETVHRTCPGVEEDIKWGFPHFMYRGMLCSMAAFKEHCAFGFWKGALVLPAERRSEAAMGQFGRISRLADLPSRKVLAGSIRRAMQLNEKGVKPERRAPRAKPPIPVPPALTRALGRNPRAKAGFTKLSPSHQREYLEWISEGKAEATRNRRVSTAVEWLAEGKTRNWKYE